MISKNIKLICIALLTGGALFRIISKAYLISSTEYLVIISIFIHRIHFLFPVYLLREAPNVHFFELCRKCYPFEMAVDLVRENMDIQWN